MFDNLQQVLKECPVLKQFAAGIGTVGLILVSAASGVAATRNHDSVPTNGFRYYPGFVQRDAVVEVAHDKGLMVEFIVNCSPGWGIITLSKVERLYCLPDHSCTGNMRTAVRKLCQ
ncbi:MAG: hypothetical protein ACI89J_000586 [Hyphomicrobiaceae bacterium]